MADLVCYCFGYSDANIRRDVLESHGRSAILERILAEKRAGRCQCAVKHPEGR